MSPPGSPDRVTITFACPPDRCRRVILALAVLIMVIAVGSALLVAGPPR